MKKKYNLKTAVWIFIFVLIWEFASRLGLVNEFILPPFSTVILNLLLELVHGTLCMQIFNSLFIVLEGFVISLIMAFIFTLLCTYSKTVEGLFHALSVLLNPIPGIAILPIVMMWFGIGNGAMLVLIIHGVLWPLITNLISGFKSVPDIYIEWAANIGLKPHQMLKDIYLYAVMPGVISGLRIGWGRAWRALISAEMVFGMIGSLGGLGYYIYANRAYANVTNVLSGVLAIAIIGLLVEQFLFKMIERNTVEKWGKAE